MKRNGLFVLTLFVLLTPVTLMADMNSILDVIYTGDKASLNESVWLVLAGAEKIQFDSDLSAADSYIKEKAWDRESDLTKKQLAVLLMDNFELPQGIMYKITGAPRYALKDLIYYGLINGKAQGNAPVSGFDLINSLNTVLEENQL